MKSKLRESKTNGPTQAPPASSDGYAMNYESENSGAMPSSAFGIPVFDVCGGGQSNGGVAGSSASAIAARNMERVLGGPFSGDNPKRYREQLDRSFKLTTKEGHVEATWTPSGWQGASSPADLSGAMAIFYAHAQSTVNQLIALLPQMEPMCRAGADKPDLCCEDIRDVLRDKLNELTQSLAAKGGPCVERVAAIFAGLADLLDLFQADYIGKDPTDNGAEICCPDDARKLAQFRLFGDTADCLKQRWINFAKEFLCGTGGASVAVAIQNAQLQLNVIYSAVTDIVRGLNRAGWSQSARDLEEIRAGGPTVGCILRWINDFVRRAMVGLHRPGRGVFRTLQLESQQLGENADDLNGWVNNMVVLRLPSQITHLMEAAEDPKARKAKNELVRTKAELAKLKEDILQCEAELQEIDKYEVKELREIDEKCASDIKGARKQDKTKIQQTYEESKKVCRSDVEKKRSDLRAKRENLNLRERELADERRAYEQEFSNIAQTVPPLAQTAVSGLQWFVLGIPTAVELLRSQLCAFAAKMNGLADNCVPANVGGDPNYRRKPRKRTALPAYGAGEGEDVAAPYGDSYNPGPSDEPYSAS